jgi:Ion channel
MKRIWKLWARFWATDKSLSILLLMLIIFGLVLPALNIGAFRRSILPDVIFTLLLISGIAAVWPESRWVFRVVATISVAALATRWLARFMSAGALASWDAGPDMIALASLALVVLTKVLRPGTITSQRIQGAVAVYLLFGLIWANAYEWTNSVHPNSFTGADTNGASWTYYSFVTLTTMGYGDITPKHPLARSLATAEALTGQLYIAILISRLVALEVASRQNS